MTNLFFFCIIAHNLLIRQVKNTGGYDKTQNRNPGGVAVMRSFEMLSIVLTIISLVLYAIFRTAEIALNIAK